MESQKFLSDILKRGANNFDILRLLAAMAVIVGHAYAIAPQPPLQDGILSLLHFDYSGSLAIKFFFFLSGLLVTNSIISKSDAFLFLSKRALRIFPGLLFHLLIAVLIIGPIFTAVSMSEYFSSAQTWRYLFNNFLLTHIEWRLTGVFNESNYGLNGSLWTLPYEVLCYIYIAIFYGLGLMKNRALSNIFFTVIVGVSIAAPGYLPSFFAQNPDSHLLPACFAMGALAANNKERIPIDLTRVLLLVLSLMVLRNSVVFQYLFYVAFFYSTLYISSLPFVNNRLRLPFDASYGVYLYGFTIQQCLHAMFPTMGVYGNQVISGFLAFGAGVLSWFVVEKRFIEFGNRIAHFKFRHQLTAFAKNTMLPNNNLQMPRHKNFANSTLLTFLLFTAIAIVIHAIALKFIFPGYYSPLSPHHSDFYVPAAFAFTNEDYYSFRSLLAYPRPVFMMIYKVFGYFGTKGSIACVIGLVCINCTLTALLIKRVFNLSVGWTFTLAFAAYCFLLFSQPYFYTFYTQDVGSQLCYFFLILGAHAFYLYHKKPLAVPAGILFFCCLLAFLSKETYSLAALFFSFLWFLYYRKQSMRIAATPMVITAVAFLTAFAINIVVKSVFVDLNASAGSTYHISLNPFTVLREWYQYTKEGINIANLLLLVAVGLLVLQSKYENKRLLAFFVAACLIATLLSWLPNSVLPHHHYKGYSFNGLYIFFIPLLLLPLFPLNKTIKIAGYIAVGLLCLISPFLNTKKYNDDTNKWVLIQEKTQTNLLRNLDSLISNIGPSDKPKRILIDGITFPFHPFAFPESLREFPKAHYANYDVVNYNASIANNQKRDLVTFIDPAESRAANYDEKWIFDQEGQLLKAENLLAQKLENISGNSTGSIQIGYDNLSKYQSNGFYDPENGMRWTNGNATIHVNFEPGDKDSLLVKLNTYMPPACKNVRPQVILSSINGKSYKPVQTTRQENVFFYVFVQDEKSPINKIDIISEKIDASPDLRTLSFPFISLEIQ
jgi:peptidoglycan/LPS O-acetylase OafA/YrhL